MSSTIHLYRIGKTRLASLAAEVADVDHPHAGHGRPATFGECLARGLGTPETPCPYVSCREHLYLHVDHKGAIKLHHGDVDVDALPETCGLRAAEIEPSDFSVDRLGRSVRDTHTLEWVASLLGVTRECVRKDELAAVAKLRAHAVLQGSAHDWSGPGTVRCNLRFVGDDEEAIAR